MSSDPVFVGADGRWYFVLEDWASISRDFETENEARENLRKYCEWLNIESGADES